jgi:hypothetical protein
MAVTLQMKLSCGANIKEAPAGSMRTKGHVGARYTERMKLLETSIVKDG